MQNRIIYVKYWTNCVVKKGIKEFAEWWRHILQWCSSPWN